MTPVGCSCCSVSAGCVGRQLDANKLAVASYVGLVWTLSAPQRSTIAQQTGRVGGTNDYMVWEERDVCQREKKSVRQQS